MWVYPIILFLVNIFEPVFFLSTHHDGKAIVANRPNIILVMADDLGYETLTCNGGTSYETPNLDRLAQMGMRFTEAYANPLCTPSRVQIMTGKYNFRNYERFGFLNPSQATFANYLQKVGYGTAIAGKWQLGGTEETPHHFGFNDYMLWQVTSSNYWNRYKTPIILKNGEQVSVRPDTYGPNVFTDFVTETMEEYSTGQKPFFIYYPMVLVHDPFQPTPDVVDYKSYLIEGKNDTTYFKNMVSHMDLLIGKIIDKVYELGIEENTLIIFTGDNGTDRQVISKMGSVKIRGEKGYATKIGTHVPLIASWKGTIREGVVTDALVDFTDFLPTIGEAAKVVVSADSIIDGKSFLPILKGEKANVREWIFCDYDPKGRDFPPRIFAQNKQFKLYADGSFYDVRNDPFENNLISKPLPSIYSKDYELLQNVISSYSEK